MAQGCRGQLLIAQANRTVVLMPVLIERATARTIELAVMIDY